MTRVHFVYMTVGLSAPFGGLGSAHLCAATASPYGGRCSAARVPPRRSPACPPCLRVLGPPGSRSKRGRDSTRPPIQTLPHAMPLQSAGTAPRPQPPDPYAPTLAPPPSARPAAPGPRPPGPQAPAPAVLTLAQTAEVCRARQVQGSSRLQDSTCGGRAREAETRYPTSDSPGPAE